MALGTPGVCTEDAAIPRSGGTYSLPLPNVQTGTLIEATWANATLSDVATALTNSLAKDGQTAPTANLNLAGFRFTSAGDATARNQFPTVGQLQDGAVITIGSIAGTNTITGSLTPAITAFATGMRFQFVPAATNTGAVTIAINGLTAKAITKFGATALEAGDLLIGSPATIVYDGTRCVLQNPRKLRGDLGLDTDDAVLFGSVLVGTDTEIRQYSAADSDITALVAGSTFGTLLEGNSAAHVVVGIRGNDANDGFHIIDTNNGGDVAYARRLLSVKTAGLDLATGSLTLANPLAVAQGGTGSASGVDTAAIVNDAVTNAKLAGMGAATVKGRASGAGTGDPVDLTAAQLVTIINTADGAGSGLDADLLDGQQGSFYRDASNINAGTLADARVAQSNVTQHQAALAVNASQVTSTFKNENGGFTVASDDAGDVVEMDSASALTVTVGSNALGGAGKAVLVLRRGAGTVTFSASGVTIRTKGGLAITTQHGAAVLIQLSSTEYQLIGDV